MLPYKLAWLFRREFCSSCKAEAPQEEHKGGEERTRDRRKGGREGGRENGENIERNTACCLSHMPLICLINTPTILQPQILCVCFMCVCVCVCVCVSECLYVCVCVCEL